MHYFVNDEVMVVLCCVVLVVALIVIIAVVLLAFIPRLFSTLWNAPFTCMGLPDFRW